MVLIPIPAAGITTYDYYKIPSPRRVFRKLKTLFVGEYERPRGPIAAAMLREVIDYFIYQYRRPRKAIAARDVSRLNDPLLRRRKTRKRKR